MVTDVERDPAYFTELDRADAVKRGLCVRNADGSPYTIPERHRFSGSMIPDFTNPAAVEVWFSERSTCWTWTWTASKPPEASLFAAMAYAFSMEAQAERVATAMRGNIRKSASAQMFLRGIFCKHK